MKKMSRFLLGLLVVIGFFCGCSKNEMSYLEDEEVPKVSFSVFEGENGDDFICVKEGLLFDPVAQTEFQMIGVNMDNNTWNAEITPGNRCMNQSSYAEIKAIGFNTVRFGLAYSMTESEDFFDWLDENMKWAEDAGLKIILDMHAPKGGIQLRSKKDAVQFWAEEEVQEDFIDLWVEIAEHYRNNSCVIMYDLLNEPLVIADSTEEGEEKYVTFIQSLIQAIRTVDKNHVICVEGYSVQRYNTTVDEFSYVMTSSEEWQNRITDDNVVFDTHTYGPTSFTMQNEGNAVSYEDVLVIVGEKSKSGTEVYSKEIRETYQWLAWETDLLKIKDSHPEVNTGVIKFMFNKVPGNTILYIDNVVVEEYDEQANYIGNVYECYFDQTPYRWSVYGDGTVEVVQNSFDNRGGSLCMMATKDQSKYTIKQLASSVNGMFEMKPNYSYKIKMVLNSNVALEKEMLRIDIAGYGSEFIGGLEKYAEYMTHTFANRAENTQNVQICNEFGISYTGMENGGAQYLYDVVGSFYDNKIGFCLFAYTGKDFGLMYDSNRDFGTELCKLRQDSYDATYKALHQDTTYDHIFKNLETMRRYEGLKAGQKVLVLGKEQAGIGPMYEYIVSTEDSIALGNGLFATALSCVK